MKASIAVLTLLLIVPGCRSSREYTAPPEADLGPPPETVRLDPAEAAAFAGKIRSELPASAAEGLVLDLWATEQLIEDPIAMDVDDQGNLYVTGSSRAGGALDIRRHPTWTTIALTLTDVEAYDRFLRQELAPARSDENEWLEDLNEDGSHDWRDLTVREERLYKILDRSGDGVADEAQILVEGFNTPLTDVLGGLLVHDDDIYLSAAPDLRLLPGAALRGRADSMVVISSGYGTHPGFNGHGMSGVTVGPDGRIYWSVGDMGMNVVGPDGKRWMYPFQGTVMRSFPDGSGFEVFARGLRNTHEFEFDEFGNLISVDNDGDHPGEHERVVYIVEGSDSGWRTNWQFGKYTDPRNNAYKVWMDEELFKPRFEGQAAYISPPVANYHSGPAGMVYSPGTALSEEWEDMFFISEYTGSPANTNVWAFRLEEDGAGFELAEEKRVVSGVLTVGMTFGADGALYLADWIEGWDSKGAGRIWRLDVAGAGMRPERFSTKTLLASDFSERTLDNLLELLRYPDLRVRRKAQFELAERDAMRTLTKAVEQTEHRLARMHGLWGIWQMALEDADEASRLQDFLADGDPEVRAQSAKILGDVRYAASAPSLVPLLQDESARVRFFASEALGKMGYAPALQPIVDMLAANADRDTYLRHAGAIALARIGDAAAVAALADHPSEGVRIAAVVALRHMKDPGAAAFLDDAAEFVVTEAARAINDDGGIDAAVDDLAAILNETPFENEPLLRRVINANLRTGSADAARRVAEFARRSNVPEAIRVEAVDVLGVWPRPSPLDRVDGVYLGEVERNPAAAQAVVRSLARDILADAPASVKVAAAQAVGRLDLAELEPALVQSLGADAASEVRVAALQALDSLDSSRLEEAVRLALNDPDQSVRMTALGIIPSMDLPEAARAGLLASALERGSVEEQQSALAALGAMEGDAARTVLAGQLDRLADGNLRPEVELDLLEAAHASGSDDLRERVEEVRAERGEFTGTLHGGDARRGRRLYFTHQSAQCTRCHALGGRGADVGPDLTGIGSRLTREQLLESLVEPGARIAPGFGEGPSAMPPMGYLLTKGEIRDLVEFLSSLE